MSNSIRSIKLEFEQAEPRELSVLYEKYEGDSRSGVQNLIARYKKQEAKLKEEENQQIVSDVASYNLSPEQLAQFLQLANSGRLQEMLSGQVPMPGAVNADTSGKKQNEDNETDMDKEEEDFLDEENE